MNLFLILFTLLSFNFAMAEVDHDGRACPNLSGNYLLPDPIFEPMHMSIESGMDAAGISTLRMITEEGEDYVLLDGKEKRASKEDSFRASCAQNAIYLYEYHLGAMHTQSIFRLSANQNLEILIDQKDKPKIRQIGIRQ